MDEEGIGFELVAASLRADATDSAQILPVLAEKLSGGLPQQTKVQYRGGLFGKKRLEAVEVDLGEVRYRLEESHGRVVATRQKSVRGIVLKNETVSVDEWIDELSRAVSEEAKRSESGRQALQRMLEES